MARSLEPCSNHTSRIDDVPLPLQCQKAFLRRQLSHFKSFSCPTPTVCHRLKMLISVFQGSMRQRLPRQHLRLKRLLKSSILLLVSFNSTLSVNDCDISYVGSEVLKTLRLYLAHARVPLCVIYDNDNFRMAKIPSLTR